jgi:hypothetical protein
MRDPDEPGLTLELTETMRAGAVRAGHDPRIVDKDV